MHEPTSADLSAVSKRPAVDIIVPVYRGMADTCRCLESVLAARYATDWRLIVINDCSPEPALVSWLLAFAQRDSRVELMENGLNLGFVGTVNRGMRVSTAHDVVLLNSDAEVANDWLDRLQSAAYRTPRVGTVTPFSNNATICSYPKFCQANELPDGYDTAELDALFAHQLAGESVEVPTAVGFCMYIQRACLDEVGLFDEENFGKGYGEENDFCWRARQAGWMHRHALDTFVRHAGGVSFGDSTTQRQLVAMQTMRRLHPDYESTVQAFVQLDPAGSARRRVDMARAYAFRNAHVYMGGAMSRVPRVATSASLDMGQPVFHVVPANGGGVDRYVRDICAIRSQDLIIHVSQAQLVIEVVAQGRFIPMDISLIRDSDLATVLGSPACLHAHSTLEPVRRVSEFICRILNIKYLLTLHDIDFVGDALDVDNVERVARHAFVRNAKARIVPGLFLGNVLSEVCGVGATWSLVENGVTSEAQSDWRNCEFLGTGKFQVAVVGALGHGKGLDFLQDVAQALKPGIRIIVFGYTDGQLLPGWLDEGRIWVYGAFEPSQLRAIVQHYGVLMAFFPNRRPESYSYALSDAWCAGLAALGPAMGAIGERILSTGAGWTYDLTDNHKVVAGKIENCLDGANRLSKEVGLAVAHLSSSMEMVMELNKHYTDSSSGDWYPPRISEADRLAATNLNSAFFRAELQRLAGDLAFARSQSSMATNALQSLGQQYEARGAWIVKLECDLVEMKREAQRLEVQRVLDHAECLEQVALLQSSSAGYQDHVARLEMSRAECVEQIARLEISRAECAAQVAVLQDSCAGYQDNVARLEMSRDECVEQVAILESSRAEYAEQVARLELSFANTSAALETLRQRTIVSLIFDRAITSASVGVHRAKGFVLRLLGIRN